MTKYLKILMSFIVLFSIYSCYEADNFYADLTKIPQINTDKDFAYKATYFVGDTMVVNGKLNAEQNLEIKIGGVKANIFSIKKIKYVVGTSDNPNPNADYMEQASFVIVKEMLGEQRTVTVKSSDQEIFGPSVDIIPDHDPNGFDKRLMLSKIATLPDNAILISCINGKGDIYYFDSLTESIVRYNKAGEKSIIISKNKPIMLNGALFNYAELTAGAVTPDGSHLYLFVKNTGLINVDLSTRNAVVMSSKTDMSTGPYEGNIADVPMVISSMRADNGNNLYLEINDTNFGKKGLAFYEKTTGKLSYIVNSNSTLPGLNTYYQSFHFSPEDHLVYLEGSQFSPFVTDIILVDIKTRTIIQTLIPKIIGNEKKLNLFGSFATLKTIFNSASPDRTFGYLPQPDKRLVYLAFQNFNPFTDGADVSGTGGLPKWVVMDFDKKMSLPLGLGKFDVQDNIFQPTQSLLPSINIRDKILNYDEEGNIYFTVNGRLEIAKTKTINP
ncbi:hypothetical protein N0B40_02840 [Chryseobacterium oranimense]|uniref:hypothetical protein n=1 Tax=Chryseobacterium oranimense TaxID=421058 RepID=UPI0021AFD1FE|nr:hypothetical protein [Chryseobacterium oranimense]UWX61218.1 hypothetical protein N0B40_02840 [Chryseobacterium oranimense]